jgi:hypothetical protein
MATCGIAPEDDDGNAASRRAPQPQPQRDVAAMIGAAISLQHLQTVWQGLSYSERTTFTAAKDKRKAELTAPAPAETAPVEREKTVDPKTGEYTW